VRRLFAVNDLDQFGVVGQLPTAPPWGAINADLHGIGGLFNPMAGKQKRRIQAVGYMRTSSATNVGRDKDSEARQRAAIEGYAKAAGYAIVDWFYDEAVKGGDAVTERPGFTAMMDRIAGNGVRTILVESPDRFARDLAVQLAGHDFLKGMGVALVPASAPDFFLEDTPTAVLVRQVLGAIAQFEKATLVAKLKAARDRKIAAGVKCGGRRSHAEIRPELVALARELRRKPPNGPRPSLREVSRLLAERGYLNAGGRPFNAASVRSMIGGRP
jgi:DNA invertase Pin-like site-specific DNA recombinase